MKHLLLTFYLKHILKAIILILPVGALAAPNNMGTFTRLTTSSNGNATGTYTTVRGDTGRFTLTRLQTNGYTDGVDIISGNNGIEIRNNANSSTHRDSFKYSFKITPDDNTAIHTIKIGQASYTTNGNSEVARQTLEYTKNDRIDVPAQAIINNNPNVPYYYESMGDYFMSSRESPTSNTFIYAQNTSRPQLRFNSNNDLYFYRFDFLNGTRLTGNRYTPSLNNGEVSVTSRGALPTPATLTNIIKSTSTTPNNQISFQPISSGTAIGNNSSASYVSYGVENSQSNYVVDVKNADSVTLTYEPFMIGNNGVGGDVVGESYNEWISFGVESEPVYVFSGSVFNDNGGMDDTNADPSLVSGIYDNDKYFNGIFDKTPTTPSESTISGSTLRLVDDCDNPSIEYASQMLAPTDNKLGEYQFTLLPNALNNQTSVCIIEVSNNPLYPIRTNDGKKTIALVPNTFKYSNNNFGRVITKNAAVVLKKYQYLNDCNTLLELPNISNQPEDTPLTGFSTKPIDEIDPGQCIAYKISAHNRSNQTVSNFVMRDVLQKTGVNGATITSKLVKPVYNTADYAEDSVALNNNGEVKTTALSLLKKTQRDFYFNTKYGTSAVN